MTNFIFQDYIKSIKPALFYHIIGLMIQQLKINFGNFYELDFDKKDNR